jgi:hypothetical protein
MPNTLGFTLPAGWCAVFDITAWHTGLNNDGPHDRQNMIMSYMQQPRFSEARAGPGGESVIPPPTLHRLEKLGRLPPARRRVLGLPEEGDLQPPV